MTLIHITDQQTDTILDTISDFWEDTHKKQLDNLETFDFVTFADQRYSQHLRDRNRVIIPAEDGGYIEFIIEETMQRLDRTKAVYCTASYLELKKQKVISPQTLSGQTAQTAVTFALSGTEWQPGNITYAGVRTIHIEQHTNPYSLLKQIASEFGLELNFRVEIDHNRVVGRYVDLVERVGGWQGREITFGKDLLGIERKEKTDQIVTALVGLGPEREDGTRLEVLVEDLDALQRWGRNGKHLVEVYEPQSIDQDMTEEQLRELTQKELEKRVNAIVEYEIDVADLENVPGMENKKIRFGDTLKIKDEKFSPPLYLEARVHTQERSIKDKSRKKVILGDFIEYTEEEVKAIWKALQQEIAKKVSMAQVMEVTYDKETIDQKDQLVYQDSTYYADIQAQPGKEAKQKIDTDVGTGTIETTTGAQEKVDKAIEELEIDDGKFPNTVPAVPSNVQATGLFKTVQLSWDYDPSSYIAAYEVYASEIAGFTPDASNMVWRGKSGGYVHKGEVNKTYYFRVRAINHHGTASDYSAQISASTARIQSGDIEEVAKEEIRQEAIDHANQIRNEIVQDIDNINQNIDDIQQDIAQKADAEWVEGQLQLKANVEDVYTRIEIDNALQSYVQVTEYEADKDGIITRLDSAESSIQQNADEIALRVTQTTYDADINDPETGLKARLDNAETAIIQNAEQIALRATKTEFQQLENEVGNIENRVSNAEATLTVHANEIATRVTQTDFNQAIDGLDSRVTQAESSIQQNANEIALRVTRTEFESLQIGGRNLLKNTSNEFQTLSMTQWYGMVALYTLEELGLKSGDTITFSVYLKDTEGHGGRIRLRYETADGQNHGNALGESVGPYEEGRVRVTHTIPNNTHRIRFVINNLSDEPSVIDYKEAQVERGNKATDWSPAPEDIDTRLTTAETSITQNANEIALRAYQSDVDMLNDRVSSAEATLSVHANEIDLRVRNDEVISRINQTPESIKIQAERIQLQGDVTVVNGMVRLGEAVVDSIHIGQSVINTAHINEISANKITTGTLNANIVNITGTLTSVTIDVSTDARVGNALYIGDQSSTDYKKVVFTDGAEIQGVMNNLFFVANTLEIQVTSIYHTGTFAGFAGNIVVGGTAEVYGTLSARDNLYFSPNRGIYSQHNNGYILRDHGNGNVSVNAAGNLLLLGYVNTNEIRVYPSVLSLMQNGSVIRTGSNNNLQFYNTGNVVASNDLRVNGNLYADTELRMDQPTGNYSRILTNKSAGREILELRGRTTTANGGAINLYGDGDNTSSAGEILMWAGGNLRFRVHANGIHTSGNFTANGSKSAVVDTENYGRRLMYAVEAPDNRFIDVIETTLGSGEHWIDLNPMFAETINGYSVIAVPQDGGAVKILEKQQKRFKIQVMSENSIEIACLVYGKRRGYEDVYMEEVITTEGEENNESIEH